MFREFRYIQDIAEYRAVIDEDLYGEEDFLSYSIDDSRIRATCLLRAESESREIAAGWLLSLRSGVGSSSSTSTRLAYFVKCSLFFFGLSTI